VRGHPGSETIAAFREDLLPARKAARIAAHLRECPRCAEIDAQLAAVTARLAAAPAPPMPASLAARLDAALAAEVAARAAAGAPAGHAGSADDAARATSAGPAVPAGPAPAGPDRAASPARGGPGTGPGHPGPGHSGPGHSGPGRGGPGRRAGRPRAGSRLSLRIAAAAAAVVVLAGGGYAIVRVVSAGGQETSASSSGAAASGSAEGRPSGSALAPEAGPRVPAASLPLVASGTRYRAGQLPAQVAAVLKRHPAHGHIGAAPPAAGAAGAAAFPHLAECVSHVAGRQRPRLVDIAHYGTRPAAVIVVPVPGTAKVQVTVAGPGCSGQGGDIITQFSMPAPG
jgi:hypothetical protein